MASANGQSILFHEAEVRAMGRQAAGVMGMRLAKGDEVVGMDVVGDHHTHVLVVTKNGYGKRSPIAEYRQQGRFGFGVRTLKRNQRTGPVTAVRCIRDDDDIMFISRNGVMLISKNGIVLRTQVSEIRETGRNTQGVKLMNLDEGDHVAGIAIMNDAEDSMLELEDDEESSLSDHNGNM